MREQVSRMGDRRRVGRCCVGSSMKSALNNEHGRTAIGRTDDDIVILFLNLFDTELRVRR